MTDTAAPDTAVESSAFEQVTAAVGRGQCILFLGAGSHAGGPDYSSIQRPPMGAELSRILAGRSRFTAKFPGEREDHLPRVALHYQVQEGRKALIDHVTSEVVGERAPSPMLHALADLDFPLVMTTNYDSLFEMALQAKGKQPILSIYDPGGKAETLDSPLTTPDPRRPFISKIHGDIRQPESLVITDEDYIQFVLRMSQKGPYDPVPITFRYYFLKWPTLFVGYSLTDYNLRLLFKTLLWGIDQSRIPGMYSVDRCPDPLVVDVLFARNRLVYFIVQDVWAFVPRLYQRVKGASYDAA